MPDLNSISALDCHLGFWLRFVSNQVSSRFEKALAAREVSLAEWVAMRLLYQCADATHAELIDALGMTKGAASKIISKLESKGLAERRSAEENPRGQRLRLTEAGRRLLPELASLADQNDAYFFGHLSEPQRNDMLQTLRDLVSHHQLKQIPTE